MRVAQCMTHPVRWGIGLVGSVCTAVAVLCVSVSVFGSRSGFNTHFHPRRDGTVTVLVLSWGL